jgi:hypothetical protein
MIMKLKNIIGDASDITEVLGNFIFTNTELVKGSSDGSKVQLVIQDQPSAFIDLNLNSLSNVIIKLN